MGRNRLQCSLVRSCIFILTLLFVTVCFAQDFRIRNEAQHPLKHQASRVRTDTSAFTNALNTATNVQVALEVLDMATSWPGGCGDAPESYNFCLYYYEPNSVVHLYVNGTLQ